MIELTIAEGLLLYSILRQKLTTQIGTDEEYALLTRLQDLIKLKG